VTPRKKKATAPQCCEETASPPASLITSEKAVELMGLFKVLANDTRLRILHALDLSKELCVGSLARALDMKPQAVSNQLQRLTDQGIVSPRRQGTTIYYRIVNPCVTELLDRGRCFVDEGCSGP
jgi:ArsR family transcriptional regulator, lead/cadmium/zinc/bismuth-responsive transcriptional repressor